MKTICISIALFFAAVMTVNAQESLPREDRRPVLVDDIHEKLLLNIRVNSRLATTSEEQREQMGKLQIEMQKGLDQLDNQLREKQARLESLEMQNVVSMKAINKNIDEQAKLLAKQMKLKAEYRQKIRAVLKE